MSATNQSQDIDLLSESVLSKSDNPLKIPFQRPTPMSIKVMRHTSPCSIRNHLKMPVQEFTAEASYYIFDSNEINDFTNNTVPV